MLNYRFNAAAKTLLANLEQADSALNLIILTGASGGLGQAFLADLEKNYQKHLLHQQTPKKLANFFAAPSLLVLLARHATSNLANQLKETCPCLLIDVDLATIAPDYTALATTFEQALLNNKWQVKLLINNAGNGFKGYIADQSPYQQSDCLNLNCVVPLSLINWLLATQRFAKDRAYILNVASSAAFVSQPKFATYSASKTLLYNWSIAFNEECRQQKAPLSCTVVCPGPMLTPFLTKAEPQLTKLSKTALQTSSPTSTEQAATQTQKAQLSWYKKLALEDPKKVAQRALLACSKRQSTCYPKFSSYLLRLLSKVLPLTFLAKFC